MVAAANTAVGTTATVDKYRIQSAQRRFALVDGQMIQHQRGADHEAEQPQQRRVGGQSGAVDNPRRLKLGGTETRGQVAQCTILRKHEHCATWPRIMQTVA